MQPKIILITSSNSVVEMPIPTDINKLISAFGFSTSDYVRIKHSGILRIPDDSGIFYSGKESFVCCHNEVYTTMFKDTTGEYIVGLC